MTVYRIPALNFPRLEKEVEQMNKRAKRCDLEPLELKIIEEIQEIRHHQSLGFNHGETIYVCSIEGDIPRLEGWTLVARIEPQKETDEDTGENIVREVPGTDCPVEYRTTDMSCDHCHVNVRRNHVWVLHNEDTGEYKQVGGSCFKDFFKGVNPDALLKRAEASVKFSDIVKEAQEERWREGGKKPISVIPIEAFVTVVALLSRQLGFVTKSNATDEKPSTASIAWDVCLHDGTERVKELIEKHKLVCREDDVDSAKIALEWAKGLDPETAVSTYLHDLGVSCRQSYVTWRRAGYVASVLMAYQRNAATPQAEDDSSKKQSKHIGEPKKRMVFKNLKIEKISVYETDFGSKSWVKFVDPDGNVLTWRASSDVFESNTRLKWAREGSTVTIKATIVEHDEFRGEKQTQINRAVLEK